jgi:hypothetical protein
VGKYVQKKAGPLSGCLSHRVFPDNIFYETPCDRDKKYIFQLKERKNELTQKNLANICSQKKLLMCKLKEMPELIVEKRLCISPLQKFKKPRESIYHCFPYHMKGYEVLTRKALKTDVLYHKHLDANKLAQKSVESIRTFFKPNEFRYKHAASTNDVLKAWQIITLSDKELKRFVFERKNLTEKINVHNSVVGKIPYIKYKS